MDRDAYRVRRRAERLCDAILNGRRAIRAALDRPRHAGDGPATVEITTAELSILLASACAPGGDKPTRRAHAELAAAIDIARERLTTLSVRGPAPPEVVTAVRLVARLAERWAVDQVRVTRREAAVDARRRARLSARIIKQPKINGSQSVLAPGDFTNTLPRPANDPHHHWQRKHWRHRTRIEQCALDLARAKWDSATGHETAEAARSRELRQARLATYTPDELDAAARLSGSSTPAAGDPSMGNKHTKPRSSSSTASTPAPPSSDPQRPKPQPGRSAYEPSPPPAAAAPAPPAQPHRRAGTRGK